MPASVVEAKGLLNVWKVLSEEAIAGDFKWPSKTFLSQ